MIVRTIHVAEEFSKFPAGRHRIDGTFSGERFRQELLAPALRTTPPVTVNLDGAICYSSSFLEEAFGGLVRVYGFSAVELHKILKIVYTRDGSLVTEIWQYIDGVL